LFFAPDVVRYGPISDNCFREDFFLAIRFPAGFCLFLIANTVHSFQSCPKFEFAKVFKIEHAAGSQLSNLLGHGMSTEQITLPLESV